MAYSSQWTGKEIDDNIYKVSEGPAFKLLGNIELSDLSKSTVKGNELMGAIYDGSILPQSKKKVYDCVLFTVTKKTSPSDTNQKPSLVVANIEIVYDTNAEMNYYYGVKFNFGIHSYRLYITEADDASNLGNWTLEKDLPTQIGNYYHLESSMFLSRLIMEEDTWIRSTGNLDISKEMEVLQNNPLIILNNIIDENDIPIGKECRVQVKSFTKIVQSSATIEYNFLLEYSKPNTEYQDYFPREIGSCYVDLFYNPSNGYLDNNSLEIRYLPTIGIK